MAATSHRHGPPPPLHYPKIADLPYQIRVQVTIHNLGMCSRSRCCIVCRSQGVRH